MANDVAMINGDSYSWSQIDITILGRRLEGVSGINYTSSQEKTNNYGRGNKPISRGKGKKSYSGSITLKEEEIKAIEAAIPAGKDIVDIKPFPIIVAFSNNGIHTIHKLLHCEFMDRGVEVNTDTTDVERQLNLIIGDINYKG